MAVAVAAAEAARLTGRDCSVAAPSGDSARLSLPSTQTTTTRTTTTTSTRSATDSSSGSSGRSLAGRTTTICLYRAMTTTPSSLLNPGTSCVVQSHCPDYIIPLALLTPPAPSPAAQVSQHSDSFNSVSFRELIFAEFTHATNAECTGGLSKHRLSLSIYATNKITIPVPVWQQCEF